MLNIYAVSYMTATRTDINSLRRLRMERREKRKSQRQRTWAPRGSWWRPRKVEIPKTNP